MGVSSLELYVDYGKINPFCFTYTKDSSFFNMIKTIFIFGNFYYGTFKISIVSQEGLLLISTIC